MNAVEVHEQDSFGSRLRKLRLSKNLTQEKFAEIFYLNKSSVSKYEKNKNFPENQLLIRIADFFDVSLDYLLCRTSQQKVLPESPTPLSGDELVTSYVFSAEETEAFAAYFKLSDDAKHDVLEYIHFKKGL